MQSNEAKFIDAVEEYLLTICQMKALLENRRRLPEIPDIPWLHEQMSAHRENAIAAGRLCDDECARLMTATLVDFSGELTEEIQDKWIEAKLALRRKFA